MAEPESIVSPRSLGEDCQMDRALRPRRLCDYVGQQLAREQLEIFISAARKRGDPLDHVLLCGPPGLGKTTLAYIIAREMEYEIRQTSGPVLERPGDLAALLTNLERGDVLFIDEMHRLSPVVEEVLYPAMENFELDLVIGEGPAARAIQIDLAPFTLIGATTRAGLLTSPLRDRFGIVQRLSFYSPGELQRIVLRSAKLLEVPADDAGAKEIAHRARGTPRIANRLLRRTRDYAEVRADGRITRSTARHALDLLRVDHHGLEPLDRRLLETLMDHFEGGPAGVDSLATALNEERDTLEDIIEPYLIQLGLLQRTPRGRMVTRAAWQHLRGGTPPGVTPGLFGAEANAAD